MLGHSSSSGFSGVRSIFAPNASFDESSKIYFLLFIVVLTGFAFRIGSVLFSYPLITHPDEPTLMDIASRMISERDPNPHFFNYPTLVIYLQVITISTVAAIQKAFLGVNYSDIPYVHFFVAGRIVATVASTVSLLAIFAVGRKLFNPWVGLSAAAITAISPLHIQNSALVTTDIWVAVFSTFVLLSCSHIYSERRPLFYAAAGIFVGLATSSKYTAIISFIIIIVAHLASQPLRVRSLLDFRMVIAGLATIFSFVATSPFVVLDSATSLVHLEAERQHYRRGHLGAEAEGAHSYELYVNALLSPNGLGYLIGMVALAGVFFALKRELRPLLLVLMATHFDPARG